MTRLPPSSAPAPAPAPAADPSADPAPAASIGGPQPDSAAGLSDRAADLAVALDEARREAEAGVPIDLAGLEDRVARLCAAAEALPRGEARTLLGPLGDLVAALDPLAAALATQHAQREEAVAAASTGRDDPHSARRRAAAAYGGPAAPPDAP